MPDDGDPEGGALFRLGDVEKLTLACAIEVVLRACDHAALGVEVAQQHVDRVPAENVVETVGVLGDAAMHVDTGSLAVAGELGGNLDDRLLLDTADLGPLGQCALLRGLENQLQAALDHCAVGQLGVDEEVAENRSLLVVDVNRRENAGDHRDEEHLLVLFFLQGLRVDVGAFLHHFQWNLANEDIGCPHKGAGLSVLDLH